MKNNVVMILMIWLWGLPCFGQGTTQTVLPLGFAGAPGNSNDGILESSGHTQQLFRGSSLQTTWTTPIQITGVAFRVGDGVAGPNHGVISQIEIRLSTSPRTPEQMSASYTSNRGSDEATVFLHNDIFLNGRNGQTVNPFDLQFSFDHPFIYDPTKGSLLMYINTTMSARGAQIDAHGFPDLNTSPMATVGNSSPFIDSIVVPYGLITEFTWTMVPEPAIFSLLILGTLAFAADYRAKQGKKTDNN